MGMIPTSTFNPHEGPSTSYDPVARLKQLGDLYQTNPGRAPMGSGSTGLASNDREGWSRMLEEQQEYLNLNSHLGGGQGINVGAARQNLPSTRTLSPATGMNNRQAFMGAGLPANYGGSEIQQALEGLRNGGTAGATSNDQFMKRYGR